MNDNTLALDSLDIGVLIAYLAVIAALGAGYARSSASTGDYFLGGRRVPWWASGLSLLGTGMSTITFLGIPAKVYATNWAYLLGVIAPLAIVPVVTRYYLPRFLGLGLSTAYEYLERRFSRGVRRMAASIFVVFHLARVAIVLVMPALALSVASGLSVIASIGLMGIVAIVYTMLGGLRAVIWTDVLQVAVLLGGALIAVGVVVANLDGGWSQLLAVSRAHDKLALANPGWGAGEATAWVILVGYSIGQLGPYTADQTYVQRYLATRDVAAAGRALWTGALAALPVSLVIYTLGTALFVFYQVHPERLPAGTAADAVMPLFMVAELPVGLAGLVLAAIFAAGMSTIDSSMNAIANVALEDLGGRAWRRARSERRRLAIARATTVAAGILATLGALWVALGGFSSLLDRFLEVLGIFAGALAGLFALGIFTRRANSAGALTGAVAAVVVVLWLRHTGAVSFFLYPVVGLATCLAVGYGVSLATVGTKSARY